MRTNNKLNPHNDGRSGNRTQNSLMGGDCSQNCASPAPQTIKHFFLKSPLKRFFLQEKARRAEEEGEEDIDDDLLLKEKAMLFSDYHQPYHFLSKEEEARAAANGRAQPGPSRHSPPRRSRSAAMEQEGEDV